MLGLALAAAIAWIEPFDPLFAAVTFGQPLLRALGIVALAIVGAAMGRRAGLVVEPHGEPAPMLFPVLVAAGVAVGCAGVDGLFRPVLHADYLHTMTTVPLAERTAAYMMRAFNENILYRLFLGSILVWGLGRVWRRADGRPAAIAVWTGFALSQALNIWINVTSHAPLTAAVIAHDGLRYFAPGMVWSWLYWRRGFQANEIASTSVHVFFQPLVGLLLR